MKNQKLKGIKIQFIIVSLLPLLALVLPFVKFTASITLLGSQSLSWTGLDLIKGIGDINNLLGSDFLGYLGGSSLKSIAGRLTVMIVLLLVVPLLLFILSAILGALSLNKNYFSRALAIPPFAAAILSGGVLIFCNTMMKSMINSLLSASMGESSLTADVSSSLSSAISGSISVKFSGEIGFWLLILAGLALGIEALVLGGKKQTADVGGFTQDAIYRQETINQPGNYPGNSSAGNKFEGNPPTTTWTNQQEVLRNPVYRKAPNGDGQGAWNTGYLTEKTEGKSGMLIGVRGEYQGAQIKIQSGEKIYIGRSSECNLVLSNAKASRKHCKVSYDAVEDKYLLTNYSGNGTYLNTGQRLDPEKTYRIPHGTAFRITKEDEFRVL